MFIGIKTIAQNMGSNKTCQLISGTPRFRKNIAVDKTTSQLKINPLPIISIAKNRKVVSACFSLATLANLKKYQVENSSPIKDGK